MTVICRRTFSCGTSMRSFRPWCLFACLSVTLCDGFQLNLVLRTCIKLRSVFSFFVVFFLPGNSPASEFYVPRFGTLCSILIGRPMKMENTECSETSAYKIQTSGNHPRERIELSHKAKVWNHEDRDFISSLLLLPSKHKKVLLHYFLQVCHNLITFKATCFGRRAAIIS
jgi:hypothetical protein